MLPYPLPVLEEGHDVCSMETLSNGSRLASQQAAADRKGQAADASTSTLANEADDVLGLLHGHGGNGAGAIGAIDQDRIDVAGIGHQPLHFGRDRRQFGD